MGREGRGLGKGRLKVSDQVKEAYAKLAIDYEKNVDHRNAFNAYYERPSMINLLPDEMEGLSALDAGCAAGWYTGQLLKSGAKVTAIDLTPEMIDATKRRVGNRATIFTHDLSKALPFENESFDWVVSSLTLHYLEDWKPTFREFHRVLKTGGRLLFSVHHPFMDYTVFERDDYFARELLHDVWSKPDSGEVEVTFYRRPLQEIINRTSDHFKIEKLIEPQPVPAFTSCGSVESYEQLMTTPHFLIVQAEKL